MIAAAVAAGGMTMTTVADAALRKSVIETTEGVSLAMTTVAEAEDGDAMTTMIVAATEDRLLGAESEMIRADL
jgi:hypothetical protein